MLAQSLIIIHDGPYMKDITPDIFSAATMIYCTITKVRCKCTLAKKFKSAGSYHGEILGGVVMQLIIHAAASSYHDTTPPVVVDCDNNDIVIHGNNSIRPLPTSQSQADLLQVFNTSSLPSHSGSNISTLHHMQIRKRNGGIAPLKNA
jgi:hypothetical protein